MKRESKKIRVVIADDHPFVRIGIRTVLKDDEKFEVIAESPNGKDALKIIKQQKPEIAILDIDMPEMNGLEVAREIKLLEIKTHVVILTVHNEKEYFDEAMNLGAKAFVVKDKIAEDITDCLNDVMNGKHYISPSISSYLFADKITEKKSLEELTPTELKILKMIGEMKTSQQIADELFRSIRTIENHRNNICQKLGLKGAHALMGFAMKKL